jgi:hypothetical protein
MALPGLSAIETSVAELTVKLAEPVTLPNAALMVAVPAATPVAVITDLPLLLMVATDVSLDVHWQFAVMSWFVESLNTPVAWKVACAPIGIVLPEAASEIEESVAFVTVKFTEALTDPRVAVITVVPVPKLPRGCPVAIPLLVPIVATVVSDEDQLTWCVRLRVPPSLKVPIAVNDAVVPWAILAFTGVMESEERFNAFTLNSALPVEDPSAAEIPVFPILSAVARPLTVIEATLGADDFQVTTPVMSCVVPSENVPTAVNCWATPSEIVALAGDNAIEVTVAEVTVRVAEPEIEPDNAEIVVVPADSAWASPCSAVALLMLATAVFDELHVTLAVMF